VTTWDFDSDYERTRGMACPYQLYSAAENALIRQHYPQLGPTGMYAAELLPGRTMESIRKQASQLRVLMDPERRRMLRRTHRQKPHEPTPEEIAAMTAQIKAENYERMQNNILEGVQKG
jgi:hypothetical protein